MQQNIQAKGQGDSCLRQSILSLSQMLPCASLPTNLFTQLISKPYTYSIDYTKLKKSQIGQKWYIEDLHVP